MDKQKSRNDSGFFMHLQIEMRVELESPIKPFRPVSMVRRLIAPGLSW